MITRLLDSIFPPQCGGCGRVGTGACDGCLPPDATFSHRLRTLEVRALSAYAPQVRRVVHALKDGRRDVAAELGVRIATFVSAGDVLVPVPTTRARRRTRGIDGVVAIAQGAAERVDATVIEPLSCIAHEVQRGKTRVERLASFGRFRCSRIVEGCEVVLVDDVCTTGTTLEDCAAALRAAGARVRSALVVALVE